MTTIDIRVPAALDVAAHLIEVNGLSPHRERDGFGHYSLTGALQAATHGQTADKERNPCDCNGTYPSVAAARRQVEDELVHRECLAALAWAAEHYCACGIDEACALYALNETGAVALLHAAAGHYKAEHPTAPLAGAA